MKTRKQRDKFIMQVENLLPSDIRKFAEKITIYNILPKSKYIDNAFCYFYSPKHKSAIFIYPCFWKYSKKEKTRIIFHEIAHVYLHFHNKKNNEREANLLAKRWMK